MTMAQSTTMASRIFEAPKHTQGPQAEAQQAEEPGEGTLVAYAYNGCDHHTAPGDAKMG